MQGESGGRPGQAAAPPPGLWQQIGSDMRRLRRAAGVSLRQVEDRSGYRRGTLSLIETGRSRPNRGIVEYYDEHFGGDGLLLSLYAEARGARGSSAGERPERRVPGDAMRVEPGSLPFGQLVGPGEPLASAWTLHNAGTVAWADRVLQRVGAPTARFVIESARAVPLPGCPPGESVRVEVPFTAPASEGSFAAYWQMAGADGSTALALDPRLSVLVVVRA
ncbi:NBR1-Ig-like domain-containing protein [Jatrophihabitans fulvus]